MSGSEFPRGLKGMSAEEAQQLLERDKIAALDDAIARAGFISDERLKKLSDWIAKFVKDVTFTASISKPPSAALGRTETIFRRTSWKGTQLVQHKSLAPTLSRKSTIGAIAKDCMTSPAAPTSFGRKAKRGAKTPGAVKTDGVVTKKGLLGGFGRLLASWLPRIMPHHSPNE